MGKQSFPVDGQKIKALRVENIVNQRDLAARAGLTVGRLSEIEQGGQNVHGATLKKLAQAFDVEPRSLLNGTGH